jgi:hypothetical protein
MDQKFIMPTTDEAIDIKINKNPWGNAIYNPPNKERRINEPRE